MSNFSLEDPAEGCRTEIPQALFDYFTIANHRYYRLVKYYFSGERRPQFKLLAHNWPATQRHAYLTHKLFLRDPILAFGIQRRSYFTSKEAFESQGGFEVSVAPMFTSLKLHEGFAVVLERERDCITVFNASCHHSNSTRDEVESVATHPCNNSISAPHRSLSPRQRDCLRWAALGKSDWEIGEILGLSQHTVHRHIEAAKRRFAVSTRVQAIIKAGLNLRLQQ